MSVLVLLGVVASLCMPRGFGMLNTGHDTPSQDTALITPELAPLQLVRIHEQVEFPTQIAAGNYSGIARVEGCRYAVANDKSPKAGFYFFDLQMDEVSGQITDARMDSLVTSGKPNRDEEGIAYNPHTHTLFVSGETDNDIIEYRMDGSLTGRKLQVPSIFKKARHNLSFEALSYNATTHHYWMANEVPLPQDGEAATSLRPTEQRLRLQSFDDHLKPSGCYAYLSDAPMGRDSAMASLTGISGLAALDDGRLIVLEREIFLPQGYLGSFVHVKLYVVNPDKSQLVSNDPLTDSSPFMQKDLLCEWRTNFSLAGFDLGNYEGICLGPRLKGGEQTLIAISDSQNQQGGVMHDWFKVIVFR